MSTTYTVKFLKAAKHGLKGFDPQIRSKILARIKQLEENPTPQDNRKVKGTENSRRVVFGNYRIIYEVDNNDHVVTIQKIGHRKEIYRNM